MVVREYAACEECGTVHVLRIGVGSEPVQAHQFTCRSCGQEMGVRLETGVGITFGPNATKAERNDAGPIVNLHPNFVFSEQEIGQASAFPSIEFGRALVGKMAEARIRAGLSANPDGPALDGPRRPGVTEEWQQLQAAWSLTRNGKDELAKKRLTGFVNKAGSGEPPVSIADWIFQFTGNLTGPWYEQVWERLVEQLQLAAKKSDFNRFVTYYGTELSTSHARRYFDTCKAYLGVFSEFSQVHQLIASNIPVDDTHRAASSNFDLTRMFYGNAFEAFGANVEVLTMLNNLINDRPFDQLRSIDLIAYQALDKAGRCRAFADNASLAAVADEFDNQIRNASHHGGMTFDKSSGMIEYRAGKGGLGNVYTMSYASYLARSAKLFIQLLLVYRLELLIAYNFKARLPI